MGRLLLKLLGYFFSSPDTDFSGAALTAPVSLAEGGLATASERLPSSLEELYYSGGVVR